VTEDLLSFSFGNITLVLLVVALGMFLWLTARSKSTRGFQFQISLFIVIWILAEMVDLIGEKRVTPFLSSNEIGMYIHVLAMATFSSILWIRFYLAKKSGKKLAETVEES